MKQQIKSSEVIDNPGYIYICVCVCNRSGSNSCSIVDTLTYTYTSIGKKREKKERETERRHCGCISRLYLSGLFYELKCSRMPFPSVNSCAINPATANIDKRPCCNSFVCMMRKSAASSGFNPNGSKPKSPGT